MVGAPLKPMDPGWKSAPIKYRREKMNRQQTANIATGGSDSAFLLVSAGGALTTLNRQAHFTTMEMTS